MKTPADKFLRLSLLIAGIAVILFSSAGVARMVGWGSSLPGDSGDVLAPDEGPASRVSCAGCGMIESVRELDSHGEFNGLGAIHIATGEYARTKSIRSYAIAIRLFDGSSRVVTDASPARWRAGEYVLLIDGAGRSSR
jgi:hypothetical protein